MILNNWGTHKKLVDGIIKTIHNLSIKNISDSMSS